MKILHINSFYNGSKFYKNLFDQQVENGLDIKVYVPIPMQDKLKNNYEGMGNYTIISPNHGKYDRFIFHLKHYKIFKDIIKKIVIDDFSVIHAHSLFSNGYIAMKLKEKYDVPYIVAVRNTDLNFFFKKMPHLRNTGIKILEGADKVILLSNSYKDLLVENYIPNDLKEKINNKISVIPNGISDFWFHNIGEGKNKLNPMHEINLLHVGVIDRNKNITTTIKAIEILKNKGFRINYNLVGRIKDEKVYEEIKDLAYINYLSPEPQEELISIYRQNDIFVMPSITETFGLVYAEAMSQGLPVIYSKRQGFDRQFINGEVGYSVESLDASDIANNIINIIEEYDNISSRCVERSSKFMWSTISRSYTKIYGEIVYDK